MLVEFFAKGCYGGGIDGFHPSKLVGNIILVLLPNSLLVSKLMTRGRWLLFVMCPNGAYPIL